MTTPNSQDQTPFDGSPDPSADMGDPGDNGPDNVGESVGQIRHTIRLQPPRGSPTRGLVRCPVPQGGPARMPRVKRTSFRPAGAEADVRAEAEAVAEAAALAAAVAARLRKKERPPLVYALGTLSYDLGPQARFDSIAAEIVPSDGGSAPVGPIPASIDTDSLLKHLEANPETAESIIWTLNLDATPIYAIRPDGAFAAQTYARLRKFLTEQVNGKVRAERVAIPGYMVGTQTLLTGQKVGVVVPEYRGMANWTIAALVSRIVRKGADEKGGKPERDAFKKKEEGITNFLQRVYHEIRNLGLEPRDRAMNFAATNAFNIERIFGEAAGAGLQLDQIDVEKSPICRLDSDCWDIVLYFFNPANVLGEARKHSDSQWT